MCVCRVHSESNFCAGLRAGGADELLTQGFGAQNEAQAVLDASNEVVDIADSLVERGSVKTAPSSPSAHSLQTVDPMLCVIDEDAPQRIEAHPSEFRQKCLDLKEFSDFDTLDLNLQVQGSADGQLADVRGAPNCKRPAVWEHNGVCAGHLSPKRWGFQIIKRKALDAP